MTFDFHPEAETEFLEAIAYYESCAPGLGEDFWFIRLKRTFMHHNDIITFITKLIDCYILEP